MPLVSERFGSCFKVCSDLSLTKQSILKMDTSNWLERLATVGFSPFMVNIQNVPTELKRY